jgi:Zn-dependent protease/predicted transcriptional regulator
MKWRFHFTRIAGIDIYVHVTFFVLLAFLLVAAYAEQGTWSAVIERFAFVVLLFSIVVMHEYGHVLAARRYGISTRDIVLYPIGGVATLERMPDRPYQELIVALAGPAVNVVLAILLYGINTLIGNSPIPEVLPWETATLVQLMWINILLVAFNMLPAYPMDGGRALRALLAMVMNPTRATVWAATIGQMMAIVFVIAGAYYNIFLSIIGVFVWLGAAQETAAARVRASLQGVRMRQAMIMHFETLNASDTLGTAIDHIIAGFQQDFPVLDDGKIVGVLTRRDLFNAVAKKGRDAVVRDFMHTDFRTSTPDEPLDHALPRFEGCDCPSMPVMDEFGRVVGLMTMENLGEFITIRSALAQAGDDRSGG